MLCDLCNSGCHLYCATPKLTEIPEEDWFCHNCATKLPLLDAMECPPSPTSLPPKKVGRGRKPKANSSDRARQNDESSLVCPICKKAFKSEGGLKYHLANVICTDEPKADASEQDDEPPLELICQVCKKEFKSEGGLKYHMANVCTDDKGVKLTKKQKREQLVAQSHDESDEEDISKDKPDSDDEPPAKRGRGARVKRPPERLTVGNQGPKSKAVRYVDGDDGNDDGDDGSVFDQESCEEEEGDDDDDDDDDNDDEEEEVEEMEEVEEETGGKGKSKQRSRRPSSSNISRSAKVKGDRVFSTFQDGDGNEFFVPSSASASSSGGKGVGKLYRQCRTAWLTTPAASLAQRFSR